MFTGISKGKLQYNMFTIPCLSPPPGFLLALFIMLPAMSYELHYGPSVPDVPGGSSRLQFSEW